MAAIIHQTDKRSGITYAYESIARWDKEKKQSRATRKLIGRVNEKGEIVPTDGRGKKERVKPYKPHTTRRFYGATYLLDAIGEKLGIAQDLHRCFGERYKQILSLSYYLILEEHTPLYRFEKWSILHKHPYDAPISSQMSSQLFASITEESKHQFFQRWARHKAHDEFWAYDTTSISSYSEHLKQVQYGYNKEHDPLAQLNLAIVFGEHSNLPFYYRKLPGNIPDATTVVHLLEDMKQMGFQKLKLVMDRGFFSKKNINALFERNLKFLISTKLSLAYVQSHLAPIYDTFCTYDVYLPAYELYARTVSTQWEYTHYRPNKKEKVAKTKRVYLHYYYNIEKAAEDKKVFDNTLMAYKQECMEGTPVAAHQPFYDKYFRIKTTPKRGIQVEVNTEAVAEATKQYGFFVLLCNETMDATQALALYRNKDVVEKAFGNLKERLSMRRLGVSSEHSLNGKLFVEFIALIFLSYMKKQMQKTALYKRYTLPTLLDKIDIIEYFQYPNTKPRVGEVLAKQKEIYEAMDVPVPR